MRVYTFRATIFLVLTSAVSRAHATVTEYHSKALWQAAVNNNYHTIDFTGYPDSTVITTQYNNVGATFTDGNDYINLSASYQNDGAGLAGNFVFDNHITVRFATLQHWIATDFPGSLQIDLYNDSTLLYASANFGVAGPGWFGGIVSDFAFNRAVIYKATGTAYIDDLYYQNVPGPGALGIFATFMTFQRRRRQRT